MPVSGMLLLVGLTTGLCARGADERFRSSQGTPAPAKTISAADCGAVGTGQQDDAPAIQKALGSGAAVVEIPAGLYRIGRTLRIGSGTTLKADPRAVIRLADGAGNHVGVFHQRRRRRGARSQSRNYGSTVRPSRNHRPDGSLRPGHDVFNKF